MTTENNNPYVFYSWQSDSPAKTNRNFIEQAIKDTIKKLARTAELENSPRLSLDRDTKGTTGNQPIFNAIRSKISNATAYVADVTYVAVYEGRDVKTDQIRKKGMPNSNVMIEYGYALNALDYPNTILIRNMAFNGSGDVNAPFNLSHVRGPIEYNLAEDANNQTRKAELEKVVSALHDSLKNLIKQEKSELVVKFCPIPSKADFKDIHTIIALPSDEEYIDELIDKANEANLKVQAGGNQIFYSPYKSNWRLVDQSGHSIRKIKSSFATETKKYKDFYTQEKGSLTSILVNNACPTVHRSTIQIENEAAEQRTNVLITIVLPDNIIAYYSGLTYIVPALPDYQQDSGIVFSGPYQSMPVYTASGNGEIISVEDHRTITLTVDVAPNLRIFKSDLLDSEAFFLAALPGTEPGTYQAICTVIHDDSTKQSESLIDLVVA